MVPVKTKNQDGQTKKHDTGRHHVLTHFDVSKFGVRGHWSTGLSIHLSSCRPKRRRLVDVSLWKGAKLRMPKWLLSEVDEVQILIEVQIAMFDIMCYFCKSDWGDPVKVYLDEKFLDLMGFWDLLNVSKPAKSLRFERLRRLDFIWTWGVLWGPRMRI